MEIDEDYSENDKSLSDYDSDDCDDPSYDVPEDALSEFSELSVKKKGKLPACEDSDSSDEGGAIEAEVVVPELDEEDQKSLEIVLKLIRGGKVEKLKVDQCKVYLRKNGLRLTGNKETLVQRIKEHSEIMLGGGEKKYPASSFVVSCKGDACTGDVVTFEQNVYDQFNLASRSASGPPTGKRIIAGRIIKESYGPAKQQHTFTIEVLWSKGEKPLPPLHPLLIKGRNLYRFNTMRQKWEDEAKRQKILKEKHCRGSLARSDREARLWEKEQRKSLKAKRLARKKEKMANQAHSNSTLHVKNGAVESSKSAVKNILLHQQGIENQHNNNSVRSAGHPQHPFVLLDQQGRDNQHDHAVQQNHRIWQSFPGRKEISRQNCTGSSLLYSRPNDFNETGNCANIMNKARHPLGNVNQYPRAQTQGQRDGVKRKVCRYFDKGRCHFGDNCKFLHEYGRANAQEMPEVLSLNGQRKSGNWPH